MEEDSSVVSSYEFRGVEYVVTTTVSSGNILTVEVEDRMTADQWKGTFDATYIEDLTHKTGNFKQFSIFVSMLESALNKVSDSVTLDLLTYSDLESLRQRKVGSKPTAQPKSASINTKRYLILTYTVEFDRIHYPLPLPYVGKPDPRALQEIVRDLKAEVKHYKHKGVSGVIGSDREYEKLQREYDALLDEKEDLETEYLQYKTDVHSSAKGPAAKELKMLKAVVKNLEEEILKERNKHQRILSKRSQEYRELMAEVEELRGSERNLRIRVKSLTNELNVYKRSSRGGLPSSQSSVPRGRNVVRRAASRERSTSRDRTLSQDRLSQRDYSRVSHPRERSRSQERSHLSTRARTPSPFSTAGTRNPRFDPTAYIKEQNRRKRETDLKSKRTARAGFTGSAERLDRDRTRKRTSSAGSVGSQTSVTAGSRTAGRGLLPDSQTRLRNLNRVLKPNRASSSRAWDSPDVPLRGRTNKPRSRMLSPPDSMERVPRKRRTSRNKENFVEGPVDSDYFDRSAEMTEIDARLDRLQQFMRSNLPT